MLIDQNDNKSDLFVNFFEKLASSSKGTAAFHLLRESPDVLVTCPYVGDHLEISFQRITFDLSGEQEKDTLAITQKITSALENVSGNILNNISGCTVVGAHVLRKIRKIYININF